MNPINKESNHLFELAIKKMRYGKWNSALEKAREISHNRLRQCALDLIIFKWADQPQVPHIPASEVPLVQNETARLCYKALNYLMEEEEDAAESVIRKIQDKALRIKMEKDLLPFNPSRRR